MLGRVLAARLSKRTRKKVIVFESPDQFGLSADTLRNHAWLQSGLLYAQEASWASAEMMHQSGDMLFRTAGLPRPTERGVFRFREEQERTFRENARRLNLPINRLPERTAREVLGAFFQSDF